MKISDEMKVEALRAAAAPVDQKDCLDCRTQCVCVCVTHPCSSICRCTINTQHKCGMHKSHILFQKKQHGNVLGSFYDAGENLASSGSMFYSKF